MMILETERLTLRHGSVDDAEFILRLLNEPSFLRFIGDRGVRTLDDARQYVAERLIGSYERNGFGLWVVERKELLGPIGICGLVKRETLPYPDIGFAFLPEFWSAGYAYESALAVKQYALDVLALPRLLAIANPDNAGSIRILEKIGLAFVELIARSGDDAELRLYAVERGERTGVPPGTADATLPPQLEGAMAHTHEFDCNICGAHFDRESDLQKHSMEQHTPKKAIDPRAPAEPMGTERARKPASSKNPPFTTTGKFTAPKFGSAGSGGAEIEPGPERD